MFNLVKKDLRMSFRADAKTVVKLILGIGLFSVFLFPMAYLTIPLFINYIFIFRSFHLDENNKCDLFFNSMPIDKEDIVYSKYLFSLIILIGSLLFIYVYYKFSPIIWMNTSINLTMALITIDLSLLFIGICLPIIFKYGYIKSSGISTLVMGAIMVIGFVISMMPRVEIELIDPITNEIITNPRYIENLGVNIDILIITGICVAIYILSMYISQKVYMKKEIAS